MKNSDRLKNESQFGLLDDDVQSEIACMFPALDELRITGLYVSESSKAAAAVAIYYNEGENPAEKWGNLKAAIKKNSWRYKIGKEIYLIDSEDRSEKITIYIRPQSVACQRVASWLGEHFPGLLRWLIKLGILYGVGKP